ncbi:serine/threonine-protein kinase [Rubritalea sp.]|uniref:serine/threonine-protein kinase n=1 Tax=Rubritalea sp. TaxID=2109375 RepID=UPI003EFA77D0
MCDEEARRQVMLGAFDDVISDRELAPPGYEILHELDRGGMAVVYLARQLQPDREVALKVMLPRFAGVEEFRIRFQREGRAMAALEHPGVLPVYQVGEWDGMTFLSMKLAREGTLQERLQEGLPDIREVVDWMIQVGGAVHFAHQRGVLHRDLKPANLLFDDDGSVYVGDFGVAKLEFAEDGALTRTEALVGTPNYLAPEVASGETNAGSVTADLYGLGAVLYECLTGRRPHDSAENLAAQLRSVVEKEVTPVRKVRPEIARDLGVICEKALAKCPLERYESVARFVEDLERWRDGREVFARPASVPEKILRWSKRHPLPATLAAMLTLAVVASTVLLVDNYQRRGEVLQMSLLERAKAKRLLKEPGFRAHALSLLEQAKGISDSKRIREEATAVLANWDIGQKLDVSEGEAKEQREAPFHLEILEEGVRVSGRGLGNEGWVLQGGVLRCEPAWSGDGRFLAMVRGLRMEVVVYDVFHRNEFSRIVVKDWPEKLIFDEEGERLKVLFEDGNAMLASVRGNILLEGFSQKVELLKPIGFTMWRGQVSPPIEANTYVGKLSKNQALLATISVSGVQIWDVAKKCSLDFHKAENQRIDAPTHAWWLNDRKLLLQVPGALEVLNLDEEGKFLAVEEIERVPGMMVEEVLENGDWIVEMREEDGRISRKVWPDGDFNQARDWSMDKILPQSEVSDTNGRVRIGDWALTQPQGELVQQVFVLDDEERVIVLTKNYTICEWDLAVLRKELNKLGL